MSEAYSSAITLPEDTSGAIEELKSRGIRFRDKGLKVLGIAALATAIAIGALLLYFNVQPMSSFSTLDLPALGEAIANVTSSSAASPFGAGDSPFQTPFNILRDLMTGTLAKSLAIIGMVMGGLVAMVRGSIMAALPGIMMASSIFIVPTFLDALAPGSSTPSSQQANGNSFLRQLADEKRYKELASAAGELMPSEQAAYLRAQIAYLTKDSVTLKDELNALAGAKLTKWSPNWERMNVLEAEAFGAPKLQGTVQFAAEVHSSMQTREKVFSANFFVAVVSGLIGAALFGFGTMLVRRARRLEEMLGIASKEGKDDGLGNSAKSFFGLKQREELEDARSKALEYQNPGWTPAWQRPGQRPAPEPVPSSAGSGPSMMEGVLVGTAAGMVASAILDDDRPSRSTHDASPAYCPPIDSPVADASPCVAGGDCGSVGCE